MTPIAQQITAMPLRRFRAILTLKSDLCGEYPS